MSDSHVDRDRGFFCHLGETLKQDLEDCKVATAIPKVEIIRRALREYIRQRVRSMKPSTPSAERLIERYGKQEKLF